MVEWKKGIGLDHWVAEFPINGRAALFRKRGRWHILGVTIPNGALSADQAKRSAERIIREMLQEALAQMGGDDE